MGLIFPNAEMLQFPYPSSICGTFADWIIILVTSLMDWFLLKTFQSQVSIQKMQQNHHDIEYYKHKKSIMPRFEIKEM